MNERIRELAEQAGVKMNAYGRPIPASLASNFDELAELIVQECMKICQTHPSIIFKNEWDADVVSTDIVSRLESHFGVKE